MKTVFELFLIASLLTLPACSDEQRRMRIFVDQAEAVVELATTEDARAKGLMYRQSLEDNHGMLFIFPADEILKLWMLNVPIPLDVGFFDAQGRLINTLTMPPDKGENTYRSAAPARYALEMNAGWFQRHGLGAGSVLYLTRELQRLPVE